MRFTKRNDVLGTINRGNPAESSLCTLCRADCEGKCETWLSSLVGRKLLYPSRLSALSPPAPTTPPMWASPTTPCAFKDMPTAPTACPKA
jgi:hypothetical protein